MPRRLLPTLVISIAAALAPAAPAAAATGPCIPGTEQPRCNVWMGKVTFVADGDTMDIAMRGDGRNGAPRVRLTGAQAMEQSRYSKYPSRRRGECHALAATARVDRLVRAARGVVRVTAQNPASRSEGRLRRSVAARIGGRWVDLASVLLAEGHALWLPNQVEYAWNATYSDLARQAADAGRHLYDPTACGAGPSAEASPAVDVQWDADGDDFENVNGEWIEITNRTGAELALGGWWVRDSALRRFRLPSGARVRPGGRLRVHVGRGLPTETDLYWGLGTPAFENITRDERAMGDGAYLFDPQGDLRAWAIYA